MRLLVTSNGELVACGPSIPVDAIRGIYPTPSPSPPSPSSRLEVGVQTDLLASEIPERVPTWQLPGRRLQEVLTTVSSWEGVLVRLQAMRTAIAREQASLTMQATVHSTTARRLNAVATAQSSRSGESPQLGYEDLERAAAELVDDVVEEEGRANGDPDGAGAWEKNKGDAFK